MTTFLLFALLGVGSGAAYAVLAQGVVLIYKGSGVVNFAQGGVAMVGAFLCQSMRHAGLPTLAAVIATVATLAAAGAAFHLVVMRPLRRAPILARVVTTLGLLVALGGLVGLLWENEFNSLVPPIFPDRTLRILGGFLGEDRLWLGGTALLLGALLWIVYKFTVFGIATRASAENERALSMIGYSPDRVAAANWAAGAALGALGGILIAPLSGLSPDMSLLIVPTLGAALLGRFSSFAVTTAGAFLIGALQSITSEYWQQTGAVEAVPFLVVIVAIVVSGRSLPGRDVLLPARLPRSPAAGNRVLPAVVISSLVVLLLVLLPAEYQSGIATSLVTVPIALSLVVVAGFVGQVSLAQMMFAGIGAFAVSRFAHQLHIPFPIPILLAGLVCVPIGILLGIPALRVRGINLAIVTLGAADAVTAMVFSNPNWTGGILGSPVPPPAVGGYSLNAFTHPVRWGLFCLAIVLLSAYLVSTLRRSPLGRRMLAVRDNERAAAAVGINVAAIKLQAFGISSFLAAIGGGVLAYQLGSVSFDRFAALQSVNLLPLVYIGGIAVVGGAVIAGYITSGGLIFVLFLNSGLVAGNWWALGTGIVLILVVIGHPDGGAVLMQDQLRAVRRRLATTWPRLGAAAS